MTFYQYLISIMIIALIIFVINSVFLKKKNLSDQLFLEGLKQENNGHFEEALINYENALDEVKKSNNHSDLEIEIKQKLKVLHTIIEYKNSIGFIRKYN
jgi:hypothetical protein